MKRIFLSERFKSVASTLFIEICFLLLFIVHPGAGKASTKQQSKQNNWFISGSTGIALRSQEISGDYKFIADGFQHQPGFTFNLSFGKSIGQHWESALRLGAYTLFGQSFLPHNSSVGFFAAYPDLPEQVPLEYITQSNSISLLLRFFLLNDALGRNNVLNIRPFFEAGLGINNFSSEVRYRKIPPGESSSLIFRDRNGKNSNGAAEIITGLGLKIGERGEWNAIIALNAEWVNFSKLNPISHFSNSKNINSRAIVSRINAGIAIPVRRRTKTDTYLPFRW